MIERHVTFEVFEDKAKDFVNLFLHEYRPAMSTMPGFLKVELLQNQEQPHNFRMVIRFESNETAAEWRDSLAHQLLKPKIKPLYKTSNLEVFDFIA